MDAQYISDLVDFVCYMVALFLLFSVSAIFYNFFELVVRNTNRIRLQKANRRRVSSK